MIPTDNRVKFVLSVQQDVKTAVERLLVDDVIYSNELVAVLLPSLLRALHRVHPEDRELRAKLAQSLHDIIDIAVVSESDDELVLGVARVLAQGGPKCH